MRPSEKYYVDVRGLKTLLDKIAEMKANIESSADSDLSAAKDELKSLIDQLDKTVQANQADDAQQATLITDLQTALDKLQETDTSYAESIKQVQSDLATLNTNLVDSINAINKNVADGFNTINGGIDNEIRPVLKALQDDVAAIKSDIEALKAKHTEYESAFTGLQSTVESLATKVDENYNTLDTKIDTEIQKINTSLEDINTQITDISSRLGVLEGN